MKAWNYLSEWTSYALPKNIQKRLYKFVLRRAIGQFLQNELDLENFDIALMNGNLELRDLDLNLQFINKLLIDTPFVLEKGSVSSISASIPWAKLLTGDISFKIQGLHILLRPIKNKPRPKDDTVPVPVEEQIMSSSLHFADDFLRTEIEKDQTQELHKSIQESFHGSTPADDMNTEGLQVLTKVIDKMMSRVKIDIVDTLVRIIHTSAVPLTPDSEEYHLDICIPRISYFDETPEFNANPEHHNDLMESSIYMPPVANETIKIITMASPEIWLRSASAGGGGGGVASASSLYSMPTRSETTLGEDVNTLSPSDDGSQDEFLAQTEFFDANQGSSNLFQSQYRLFKTSSSSSNNMSGSITPKAMPSKPYEALLFTTMDKKNWVRVKLRPNMDGISFMSIKQIDFLVTHIRAILSPLQLAFFLDLLDTMTTTQTQPQQQEENNLIKKKKSTGVQRSSNTEMDLLDDLDSFNSAPSSMPSNSNNNNSGGSTQSPELKIKFQLSLIELLLLGDDHPVKDWTQPADNKNHVRFAIQQLNIRLQHYPDDSHHKHYQRKMISLMDMRIGNVVLDEWIVRPLQAKPGSTQTQTEYDKYNPIFQFDNRIRHDYAAEEHFPTYVPQPHRASEQVDAVRIRVERRKTIGTDEDTSSEEDIHVEIPPFKLHIDPRIIDRLDKYIYAVTAFNKDKEQKQGEKVHQVYQESRPSVYDDLRTQQSIQKRKVRVKCAFIRILLFVPDMSQTSTREEFNDSFHASQLSIDIQKLVGTWCSTTILDDHTHTSSRDKEKGSGAAGSASGSSRPRKPNKLNIELNYVNVFMRLKQDEMARCWFTAKTMHGSKGIFSEGGALSPSIEITLQDSNPIYPTASTRSGYFGAGSDIPENLFNFLDRNENFNSEQKLHIPMDEQAESALIFKHRTIETSMIVVNCHFPQADMNLTKQIWDKVQIIQNDLLLWQPQFLIGQQQQVHSPSEMSSSQSMDYHNFFSDMRSTSSVMSQSYERLRPLSPTLQQQQMGYFPPPPQQQQSLVSIIAVMSSGTWNINTSPGHIYRLQFSEFKYFAAMKHLGQNENITTLDIEDLDVTDISDMQRPVKLLYKTTPKKIHPKRNTSMVSLFSKLQSFPESNKINKVTSVVACNLCWKATPDVSFVNEIVEFQKVPEEMVFIDPPTQYIKVFAHILETSVDYEPIHSPTRAIVILDGIEVVTNILAHQPIIEVKTFVQNIELFLIDDKRELDNTAISRMEGQTCDARKFWTTLGFCSTLAVQNIELCVKIKLDEHVSAPQMDIALASTDICLGTSADSFQTLLNLITFAANNGDANATTTTTTATTTPTSTTAAAEPGAQPKSTQLKKPKRPKVYATLQKEDMLASIDETAFKSNPQKLSPPTLIEAPEMEEFSFVEEFYHTEDDLHARAATSPSAVPPTKPRRKQHRHRTAEDIIRVLLADEDDSHEVDMPQLHVIENFFGVERKAAAPKSVVDLGKAVLSLRVDNVNVVWKLYDGYDWAYVRSDMVARETTTTVGEDDPVAHPKQKRRNGDTHIEFKLESVSLAFDVMPDTDATAFYAHLKMKDVEIIDNIRTSAWKKFLGYMRSGVDQREIDDCMVDVELISLRPVVDDPQQEYRLKAKLLPLRLYIDQDAMSFLQKYFLFEKAHLRSTHAANMSISKAKAAVNEEEEEPTEEAKPDMFFQHVEIYPITLKVDYKPKIFNVGNFREGQVVELLNLFRLDAAEISLTHVKLTSIKGMDGLLDRLGQEWLPHILNTQKINMVSGVSPVRSIVNLSTGVADLVLLPIQQYRKDGRLMKGIQRGTSSFARATAIEAIKLSSRVATGTQVILEHADGFFSPQSSAPYASSSHSSSSAQHLQQLQNQHFVFTDVNGLEIMEDELSTTATAKAPPLRSSASTSSAIPFSKQSGKEKYRRSYSSSSGSSSHGGHSPGSSPSDLAEGLQFAYQNISRNLGSAAQTIFAVPTEVQTEDRLAGDEEEGTYRRQQGAKAVIRAVPVAVIKPMIGLTGAFQSILTGLRNSIDPVMRLQSEDKYKKPK